MPDQPKTRSAFIVEMIRKGYTDKLAGECANIVDGYGGFDTETQPTDQPVKAFREAFKKWADNEEYPLEHGTRGNAYDDICTYHAHRGWQAAKADTAESEKRLKLAIGGLRSIAYGDASTWPNCSSREVAKQALKDCGGEKPSPSTPATLGRGIDGDGRQYPNS